MIWFLVKISFLCNFYGMLSSFAQNTQQLEICSFKFLEKEEFFEILAQQFKFWPNYTAMLVIN
jgi:hypothetical protein